MSTYRVLSLADLLLEGPEATWRAFCWLTTSDHERLVSSEVGTPQAGQVLKLLNQQPPP